MGRGPGAVSNAMEGRAVPAGTLAAGPVRVRRRVLVRGRPHARLRVLGAGPPRGQQGVRARRLVLVGAPALAPAPALGPRRVFVAAPALAPGPPLAQRRVIARALALARGQGGLTRRDRTTASRAGVRQDQMVPEATGPRRGPDDQQLQQIGVVQRRRPGPGTPHARVRLEALMMTAAGDPMQPMMTAAHAQTDAHCGRRVRRGQAIMRRLEASAVTQRDADRPGRHESRVPHDAATV